MKLLFLCKRRPQQRDLLERPYGRFHALPAKLATRGHDVHVALLSYRFLASNECVQHGARWYSDDLLEPNPLAYLRRASNLAGRLRPDWIIGCSDVYYGIAAVALARRCSARAAIDAYDNFEGYMPWAKPLHWLWHRALSKAELVTAAGPQLAALLKQHHRGTVEVLPMAADPQFGPADRIASRQRLGLPVDVPLIGHCGSFTTTRGSHVLLEAFAVARAKMPQLRLVMTGRYPAEIQSVPGVIGLGMQPDDLMPTVLNSLNVACVVLADTAFGRYSYPAKLYEAMVCGVPVVASATEPTRWILGDAPMHLARVGDADDLAAKILHLLESPTMTYPPLPAWSDVAARFESLLAAR